MGIWDYIYSAGDFVKRNTPDQTSVKSFCRGSYEQTCSAAGQIGSAVGSIGNVVKVHGVDKVSQQLREEENRAAIRRFAGSVAVNTAVFAFHEGIKIIPGGAPVYNIVSRSVSGSKNAPSKQEEVKELRARMERMEGELVVCRRFIEEQGFTRQEAVVIPEKDPQCINKKPEDAMKASIAQVTRFCLLDDLIVPGVRSSKKP